MIGGTEGSLPGRDVFGTQLKKTPSVRLTKLLDSLAAQNGAEGGMGGISGSSEPDLSSFVKGPKLSEIMGRISAYDPNQLYGALYRAYGGQKVRGGLLGD